jgi:hypothetical protein
MFRVRWRLLLVLLGIFIVVPVVVSRVSGVKTPSPKGETEMQPLRLATTPLPVST